MGSDMTLLSAKVAKDLGIDLAGLSKAAITSALGTTAEYTPFDLTLELRRYPHSERWHGSIGFLATHVKYNILGTKGFFEFFVVKYDWRHRILDIERSNGPPS
jgi:hypothetical protein